MTGFFSVLRDFFSLIGYSIPFPVSFSTSVTLKFSFWPSCPFFHSYFFLCFYFEYGFNLQLFSNFFCVTKSITRMKEGKKKKNRTISFLVYICTLPDLNYGSKILLNPSKIDLTYLWITIWPPLSQEQKSWYWRKSNSS